MEAFANLPGDPGSGIRNISDRRVVIPVPVSPDLPAFQGDVKFLAGPDGVRHIFSQSDGDIVVSVAKDLYIFSVDSGIAKA